VRLSLQIFIVLELITGGELFDKIVAESRFDEKTARFYFRQLLKGVTYCHKQGVCHRDLKPENLLLDERSDLKISDFGLSALYTGSADDEGRATVRTLSQRRCCRGGALRGCAERRRKRRGVLLCAAAEGAGSRPLQRRARSAGAGASSRVPRGRASLQGSARLLA
jgi:serine/threonine protein kinase